MKTVVSCRIVSSAFGDGYGMQRQASISTIIFKGSTYIINNKCGYLRSYYIIVLFLSYEYRKQK